jgi:hypothetical protein
MIDVVGAHVFIVCLLPAERKLVADTIRERLRFGKPRMTKGKRRMRTNCTG